MTTDLMLVTRREPTTSDVRAGVKAARRDAGLGVAELVGEWSDDDPLVEISAGVSDGELLLQLFHPSVSLTTAAQPYTLDLGLAPPGDGDGQCWLTAGATSARATDEQTRAALEVVRHILIAADGFLVVNGEYTPLDGVPEPERIVGYPTAPKTAPPARAFWRAFLPVPALGDSSWPWATGLLRRVLSGHPDLRPRLIEQDGEWRPFLPGRPAPQWWPATQKLLTVDPYLTWQLSGASGPLERYSELDVSGDLAPDDVQALLPQLVELAGHEYYRLDYGLVHVWHPDEPNGPRGLKLGTRGSPTLSLTSRDLAERCLPNLYWAQVFGPPWVQLFGAATIASTPAHRVVEVAPDHWLVQLTDRVADVVDDHAAFERVRAAAKAHLGGDAFYDPATGVNGSYRVPHIPTLEQRGLVIRPPS